MAQNAELSDGAIVILALCCRYAAIRKLSEGSRQFHAPQGGWANALGCSHRSAQRYLSELVNTEFIKRDGKGVYTLDPKAGKEAILSGAGYARVSLTVWPDPALPVAAKRLLIVLSSFANPKRECWPTVRTLAAKSGWHRSKVFRMLKILQKFGLVTKQRQGRHRASIYKIGDAPCMRPLKSVSATSVTSKTRKMCHQCNTEQE